MTIWEVSSLGYDWWGGFWSHERRYSWRISRSVDWWAAVEVVLEEWSLFCSSVLFRLRTIWQSFHKPASSPLTFELGPTWACTAQQERAHGKVWGKRSIWVEFQVTELERKAFSPGGRQNKVLLAVPLPVRSVMTILSDTLKARWCQTIVLRDRFPRC